MGQGMKKNIKFLLYIFFGSRILVPLPTIAFEPVYSHAKGKQELIDFLEENQATSLSLAYDLFSGSGEFRGEQYRYLYSKAYGWVDMRHFFLAAAHWTSGILSPASVLSLMEEEEAKQAREESYSAYSYDDLPSNLYGAFFRAKMRETDKIDFLPFFEDFLGLMGIEDKPLTVAPNVLNLIAADRFLTFEEKADVSKRYQNIEACGDSIQAHKVYDYSPIYTISVPSADDVRKKAFGEELEAFKEKTTSKIENESKFLRRIYRAIF